MYMCQSKKANESKQVHTPLKTHTKKCFSRLTGKRKTEYKQEI